MTENSVRDTRNDQTLLVAVASIHAALFGLVVFEQRYLTVPHIVVAIGFLLGQCSTVTAVCVIRPGWWLFRQTIPWLAAAICWYGLSRVALWGHGTPGAAWWGIGILTQTITILLLTSFFGKRLLPTSETDNEIAWRFPIRSLIFLSTLSAIGFSIAQYGQRSGMWSAETIGFNEAVTMVCVGLTLGINAWLCQWVTVAPSLRKRLFRLVMAGVLIGLLGIGIDRIATWANMGDPANQNLALELLVAHAICVGGTLAVLNYPLHKKLRQIN